MTVDELKTLAFLAAKAEGLDPALVCAVCHHESANWKAWAIRYEPGFYDRYISHMSTLGATEKMARAFSYGLMQVMGQTAREFGFSGEYLTELCDPFTNLKFGCKKLARCLKLANGDVHEGLLKYNGGGDPSYPDKVLKHYDTYKL